MNNESQVRELLTRTREEIRLADQKASILLAGITALLGIEIGNLAKILDDDTSCNNLVTKVHLAFLFAAILSLVAVLFPRGIKVKAKPSSIGYFGDVNWYSNSSDQPNNLEALVEALRDQDKSYQALINQLISISRITYKKFKWVKCAIINLCISLIPVGYLVFVKVF